ncbi:unnamed protein product [Tuber aestivum]|uniref:Uncharacterized protein n=1 Tax=Tuber aestivum TaxID=59557 RepID=A0A292Q803_9PEZI|nr:unnamed protein product [Tuber aestivum]
MLCALCSVRVGIESRSSLPPSSSTHPPSYQYPPTVPIPPPRTFTCHPELLTQSLLLHPRFYAADLSHLTFIQPSSLQQARLCSETPSCSRRFEELPTSFPSNQLPQDTINLML